MFPFSVLLSIYKNEKPIFLRQSLDSVFTQTALPAEVVLVEDGELTEELYDVLNAYSLQYPSLKRIPLDKNCGLGKALNEGLKHCSFDLVARMDTDDIAVHDRFEKQLVVMQQHPEIDLVGSWIKEFDSDTNKVLSIRKVPEKHRDILVFAKWRNPINHPVVMFRKKAVLKVGGYLHFPLFEDYYLWIRMLIAGSKFYNIRESLLYFRMSSSMFKRRGGFDYLLTELYFQNYLRKSHFISLFEFVQNVFARLFVRLMPNVFRGFLYKKVIHQTVCDN